MEFYQVEKALKDGKKVKLSNWKNAYWQYDPETKHLMNHFEESGAIPVVVMFPLTTAAMLTSSNWEIVEDEQVASSDTCPFGDAMNYLKAGKKVARKGWNGKNMFLFLADDIEFHTDADLSCVSNLEGDLTLPAIVMKTADDRFCVGWLASQTDMLSDDWFTVE